MPSQQEFLQKQDAFNNEWDLEISIDNMEILVKKISALKDFTSVQNNGPKAMYAKIFNELLKIYLTKNTTMAEDYLEDVKRAEDFKIEAFVDSYEELMAERPDKEGAPERERKPFEGYSRKDMLKFANKIAEPYSRPMPSIWAKNIKNGIMDIQKMRELTDGAYNALNENNPGGLSSEPQALRNIYAAHEAVRQLRAQRSFIWHVAFWHWPAWYREASYLKHLAEQKQDLIDAEYSFEDAATEMDANTFELAEIEEVEVNQNVERVQLKNVNLNNTKAKESDSVYENVAALLSNNEVIEKFIVDLNKGMPTEIPLSDREENIRNQKDGLLKEMFETVQKYNAQYDRVEKGLEQGDHETILEEQVKAVFIVANRLSEAVVGEDVAFAHRLFVAQLITDKVMKDFSPARYMPMVFKQYAQGQIFRMYDNPSYSEVLKDESPRHVEEARANYKILAEMRETLELKNIDINSPMAQSEYERIKREFDNNVEREVGEIKVI